MIVQMIKNPDFVWYRPKSWLKVPELIIEKDDFIVMERLWIKQGVLNHKVTLDFIGKSQEQLLADFEIYLKKIKQQRKKMRFPTHGEGGHGRFDNI